MVSSGQMSKLENTPISPTMMKMNRQSKIQRASTLNGSSIQNTTFSLGGFRSTLPSSLGSSLDDKILENIQTKF